MNLTQKQAARILGITVVCVGNYDRGMRYGPEGEVDVPIYIRYACAAIENNLPPI